MTTRRRTLCFDFDGVIHSSPEWLPVCAEIDTEGIRQAHAAGYAVAVMTCSPLGQVAEALEAHGLAVRADHEMRYSDWHGGPDGRTVLITGRKIVASAYLDDRAVHYRYGQPWADAFTEIDRQAAARRAARSAAPAGQAGTG